MANLSTKIKMYCDANGVSEVDFSKDIMLQDTEEANAQVRSTRKAAYGDVGEQLDEIYKNINSWKARIKSIKDNNPKS